MKRESAYILFVAVFVVGYIAGRATSPKVAVVSGPAAVAVAPAAVAPAAAAGSSSVESAPAPAPTPAPAPAPAPAAAPAKPDSDQVWRVAIHPDDARKGPENAPVKVVIMSAFGCQECADFARDANRLFDDPAYKGKLQYRFKHKIIPPQHPDSIMASEASMCANEQKKFWEFHDKLMASPFAISRANLDQFAAELKLNKRKFDKCLDSHEMKGQLARDSVLANETGSHSFPNILANGVRIGKPKAYDALKTLIDNQLERVKKLKAEGATDANLYDRAIAGGKFFPQTEGPRISFNTANSATIGPKNAKIEVVTYEDFQCPFCSKVAPNLKTFQKNNPNDVKVVFKHLPLVNIHEDAQLASEASMEALAQGKFWEYHDVLFENQHALKRPDLENYAKQVGLDMGKLRAALDSRKHQAAVDADAAEAQRAGISGTPSIFINGLKYQGPRGYPPDGLEGVARMYLGL